MSYEKHDNFFQTTKTEKLTNKRLKFSNFVSTNFTICIIYIPMIGKNIQKYQTPKCNRKCPLSFQLFFKIVNIKKFCYRSTKGNLRIKNCEIKFIYLTIFNTTTIRFILSLFKNGNSANLSKFY